MSAAGDIRKVTDALIVLSGHLPLFVSDKRTVARAEQHLALRDEALAALDRLVARVHALEQALDGFLRFADADEAANPPGHRNSVLRVHRNVFTEARAARAVVLEGAARQEQTQDLGGDVPSPVVPQRDSEGAAG